MGNEKPHRLSSASMKAVALCLLSACVIACRSKPTPAPEKEPPAPSATASEATPAPTASAEVKTLPTLEPEKFAPAGSKPDWVYAVEGALMVAADERVGRIVDESIEWVGKIPKAAAGIGSVHLDAVVGRWPDSIGALYSTDNGRAAQPTYMPLTGIGERYVAAQGGGLGEINGVARLGESTILAGYTLSDGVTLKTVRGTVVRKPQTPEQAGCKEGEVWKPGDSFVAAAISPSVIESTQEGTLVSLGRLCDKRGPAAEVWDKSGKSRIIDLGRFWKKIRSFPKLLKGSGDELWAFSSVWSHVLHYRNGEFEAVPDLERPIQNLFVSPRGQLHASDGQRIHRYDGGKWIPIAYFAASDRFTNMVMDDKETIWVSNGAVQRLRPAASVAVPEGCATPFVYLYQGSSKNGDNFTYPATRKALSSFAEVSAIGLLEFEDEYERQLGITVSSKAQGEAVIAHLKETMKDEDPRLVCFEPTKKVRKIDMRAAK